MSNQSSSQSPQQGQSQPLAEACLKMLLRNAYDATLLYPLAADGKPGPILQANEMTTRLFGYSLDELKAMTPLDLVDVNVDLNAHLAELQTTSDLRLNSTFVTRAGRTLPVEVHYWLLDIEDQRLVLAIIRDLTEQKRGEAQLRADLSRLKALFNNATDPIFCYEMHDDRSGRLIETNEAATNLLGYSRDEFLDMKIGQLSDSSISTLELIQRILEQGSVLAESLYVAKDGSRIPVEVHAHCFELQGKRFIQSVVRDMRERKRVEHVMQKGQAFFRAMFEQAAVGVSRTALNGRIMMANRKMCDMLGYTAGELYNKTFRELTHPADRNENELWVQQMLEGELSSFNIEKRYLRKDGSTLWANVTISIARDTPESTPYFIALIEDITDRRNAELSLIHEHALAEQRARQIRNMAAELTLSEQRERRRLANLVHDQLQQLLVASKMRLGMASQALSAPDDPVANHLYEAEHLLRQTIAAARSLTVELSPQILFDAGLAAALRWLSRHLYEQHRLRVHVEADSKNDPHTEASRIILFHAVHEMLDNVLKHAKVREARVRLSRVNGSVQVEVVDEGVGFEPAKVWPMPHTGTSLGLGGLRQRFDLLGGTFLVASSPGLGTHVTLCLPDPEPQTQAEFTADAEDHNGNGKDDDGDSGSEPTAE